MPASPRSPKTATGKAGEPLAKLLDAANAVGYRVDLRQAVSASGGVNPTRIDLRLGPHLTKLLVYSWFMTLEGFGRGKDDFRIQTTRAHAGPLMDEKSRVTVGIGWRREDDVFVGFDGWAKRYTGGSSSVHTRRALIATVKKEGWVLEGRRHDARLGFDAPHVAEFVRWAHGLHNPKVAAIVPVSVTTIDANTALIVGKVHASQPTSWMREKDRLLILDSRRRVSDRALWRIASLEPIQEKTKAGYPRRFIQFRCRRVGTVDDLPKATIEALT